MRPRPGASVVGLWLSEPGLSCDDFLLDVGGVFGLRGGVFNGYVPLAARAVVSLKGEVLCCSRMVVSWFRRWELISLRRSER